MRWRRGSDPHDETGVDPRRSDSPICSGRRNRLETVMQVVNHPKNGIVVFNRV